MSKFAASLYERFGLNAYVQGDYQKALKYFRYLEEVEPDSIRVLRNMGVLKLAMGDAEGAKAYLLKEERLYGPGYHRHAALADLAYAAGDRKEASRRYALALKEPEAKPDGSAAMMRPFLETRIAILADPKSFADSRESMNLFIKGEKARDSGDFSAAFDLFVEAGKLDATNWPAINNAGSIALNHLGDPEQAFGLFSKAFELSRSPQVARNANIAQNAMAAAKGKKGASAKPAKEKRRKA